jgi:FkbM family methyltransferase
VIHVLEALAKYNIPVSGLLHIGANTAAEAHEYIKIGSIPIIFFEPIPRLAEAAGQNTRGYANMTVAEVCCSERDNVELTFNIASNNGQSSSMLELGSHRSIYPSINYVDKLRVRTTRIATFLTGVHNAEQFNCAVIDTQGADLKVLKGFGSYLDNFDALYVEVADQPLYKKGATIRDVQAFLHRHEFALLHLESTPAKAYGNALFVRRRPAYLKMMDTSLSRGKPSHQSSVYRESPEYAADRGNDGSLSSSSFFHTALEDCPWWEVDMQKVRHMRGIYIFDRAGYESRSDRLLVKISDNAVDYSTVFSRQDVSGQISRDYFVNLDATARYVRIQLNGKGFLHLSQVIVV